MAAHYFGATEVELHHRGYWGFVRYRAGDIGELETLIIASVGPIVGVLFGYLCLSATVLLKIRKILRRPSA